MVFAETVLTGAFVIDLERREDERGFFARSWCQQEFEQHGLNGYLAQCNVSFNEKRGTLRGMHYQAKPYQEAKLVRCTRGAVYDVIIDLRADSRTYLRWVAVELNEDNRRMLYAPEGFAHGFQCLQDCTEVFYQMSEAYHPECAKGVRWNDPVFAIRWPEGAPIISARDRSYPDFMAEQVYRVP